jgi:hypothetical protein
MECIFCFLIQHWYRAKIVARYQYRAPVIGTNRLVTGSSLMPVTFAVIGNGQRLLPVTNIVTQITGTSRLVTSFSLMPVTFAVIGNGQRLLPVTNIVAQVTGTSRLVTGFSLMPVTCASYW